MDPIFKHFFHFLKNLNKFKRILSEMVQGVQKLQLYFVDNGTLA